MENPHTIIKARYVVVDALKPPIPHLRCSFKQSFLDAFYLSETFRTTIMEYLDNEMSHSWPEQKGENVMPRQSMNRLVMNYLITGKFITIPTASLGPRSPIWDPISPSFVFPKEGFKEGGRKVQARVGSRAYN